MPIETLSSTSILAAAEAYWRMGLPITPLRGKRPAMKDPFRFRPDPASLRFWFQAGCNIGLITGDYIVLDTDTEAAEAWVTTHGLDRLHPMRVRTGRGGLHRYFRAPPGTEIRNRQGLHRIPGLDVRGRGGVIVFPPSIHPDTGRRYAFATPLRLLPDLPVFDPSWLHPVSTEPCPMRKHRRQLWQTVGAPPREQVRQRIHRTFAISGQGGHNATFAVACELVEAGFGFEEALAELTQWNRTNARPPWSGAELEHKVRDAVRRVLGTETSP